MRKHELQTYFNWSCALLVGDPVEADGFLRHNMVTIKKVAGELLRQIDYEPMTVYRGVIIKQRELTRLEPHNGFTYLSFSENVNIALKFANPADDMAFMVRHRLGEDQLYGYVAEYVPQQEEVLFHHHFLQILPYVQAIYAAQNVDASRIHLQEEVTILQPAVALPVKTPYDYYIKQINK